MAIVFPVKLKFMDTEMWISYNLQELEHRIFLLGFFLPTF